MNVKELNRDQLNELKGRFLDEKLYEEENRGASYGELANADEIVSDETIFEEYECYDFSSDDFFCTGCDIKLEDFIEKIKMYHTPEEILKDFLEVVTNYNIDTDKVIDFIFKNTDFRYYNNYGYEHII